MSDKLRKMAEEWIESRASGAGAPAVASLAALLERVVREEAAEGREAEREAWAKWCEGVADDFEALNPYTATRNCDIATSLRMKANRLRSRGGSDKE